MSFRQGIAIAVILIALAFIIVMRGQQAERDWSAALASRLSGVFLKYGLVDDNLTRKSAVERKVGSTKYTHTTLEYAASKAFEWKAFEGALTAKLKNSPYRITRSDQVIRKDLSICTLVISRGTNELMNVRITKRKRAAAVPVPAAPAAAPVPVKAGTGPKVAIVLDDFGYNKNNLEALFAIRQPVTLSVLPHQRFSAEVAQAAESRGYEVILHLPLEPHRKNVEQEADTIRTGMSEKQVATRIDSEVASVPGVDGVSNHMGSKATEDRKLMTLVLQHVKAHKLYFFDSLTSERSVCAAVASDVGIRYGRRDIFLDNSNDEAAIEAQMREVRDMAFARGKAIAVGHDRKNTVAVLSRMMPEMAKEGIRFVYLSEMVD